VTFEELLHGKFGRGYIYEDGLSVYMRITRRILIGPGLRPTIDIANINLQENRRGQGVFTAWLERIEARAGELGRAVFVENLHNKKLYAFLKRRGYQDTTLSHPECPSVFLHPKKLLE